MNTFRRRISFSILREVGCALAIVGLWFATGCQRHYRVPETPMPANTILLSGMMQQLSAQPGFTESLLSHLGKGTMQGPALMTPTLIDELRKRILGKDWEGLDRFPGWTMRALTPSVQVVSHFAANTPKQPQTPAESKAVQQQLSKFLDLGPYPLDRKQSVSLDAPSPLPPFTNNGTVTQLGFGVVRGDGPNDLAAEHAESQRIADILNRMAANSLEGMTQFAATIHGDAAPTPQALIEKLAAMGYDINITDSRYFANFGHFHFNGQDVMMPFWINSGMAIPHTGGLFHRPRPLLVPVSHAEYELHIKPPPGTNGIHADVSYYFGIDGKSEWRTMDTLDQAWVLRRDAHVYRGAQAIEVMRLTTLLTIAYIHAHLNHPELPFGGYFALGVCQDGVSAIERKLTGTVTLFPNTADAVYFRDTRDPEVNEMIRAIPKDRGGAAPEPERVFGSLPTADFKQITIPGLSTDLAATYDAWQKGHLGHTADKQ